jgi:hypothetical protein
MVESRVKAEVASSGCDGRNLTTHSTRPLGSISLMFFPRCHVEGCSLAAG